MVYSLANYKVAISINDSILKTAFGDVLTVGGNGSQLESMSVDFNASIFSKQTYSTGGYVFDKSYDRSGSLSITLNQLSEEVGKFKNLINMYYAGDYETLSIVLTNNENEKVIEMIDCLPSKIPTQQFQSSAQTQTWGFEVGRITVY